MGKSIAIDLEGVNPPALRKWANEISLELGEDLLSDREALGKAVLEEAAEYQYSSFTRGLKNFVKRNQRAIPHPDLNGAKTDLNEVPDKDPPESDFQRETRKRRAKAKADREAGQEAGKKPNGSSKPSARRLTEEEGEEAARGAISSKGKTTAASPRKPSKTKVKGLAKGQDKPLVTVDLLKGEGPSAEDVCARLGIEMGAKARREMDKRAVRIRKGYHKTESGIAQATVSMIKDLGPDIGAMKEDLKSAGYDGEFVKAFQEFFPYLDAAYNRLNNIHRAWVEFQDDIDLLSGVNSEKQKVILAYAGDRKKLITGGVTDPKSGERLDFKDTSVSAKRIERALKAQNLMKTAPKKGPGFKKFDQMTKKLEFFQAAKYRRYRDSKLAKSGVPTEDEIEAIDLVLPQLEEHLEHLNDLKKRFSDSSE